MALVLLLATGAMDASASAVQDGEVRLTLAAQSAWNGPSRPLEMTVRATNDLTQPLDGLEIVLTIGAAARSRSAYELSLRDDATSAIFTYPFHQEGTLEPGQTRSFRIRQGLDLLTARGESALYPLRVELRSADVPVATIRSPLIFLIEPAEVPLNLAWAWVFAAPVLHGPDGRFLSGELEADVSPGGRLHAMAAALNSLEGGPANLVVSPVLLEQLASMAGGYEVAEPGTPVRSVEPGAAGAAHAETLLETLRRIAGGPATELTAQPFGDPSIPALFGAGLGGDLSVLNVRGRDVVSRILEAEPDGAVYRPPYSHLDSGTLGRLAVSGVRTLLLDQGFVPPPADLTFSPSPAIRLSGGGETTAAVAPDVELAAIVRAHQGDPRLAAHAALGHLAAIWFEFPGTPGRGAAILFEEDSSTPPGFFGPFASLVRASPWLAPRPASAFIEVVDPHRTATVAPRSYPAMEPEYVTRIRRGKGELRRFEATVQERDRTIEQLEHDLLLAEAGTFVSRADLGGRFLDRVSATIFGTYARVSVPRQVFTLTSRSGTIPVEVRNDTGRPLRVEINLIADRRLEFVTGSTRELVLSSEREILRFTVRARTTGLLPINVQVQTPGGGDRHETIARSQVLIRSTAYNRVALFLTIGAAVFLLGWWGRRLLPRRRS
jgi:hypothetical protein